MRSWQAWVAALVLALAVADLVRTRREAPAAQQGTQRAAEARSETQGEARRHAAFGLHRNAQWDQAVAAYGELLRDNPRDVELLYFRGVALWELDRFAAAEDDFRALVALDPVHFKAHEHLDQLLSRARRYDECVALWTAYTRVAPRDPDGHYLRGWAFLRSGDTRRAHADVSRACELGKDEACRRADSLKERLEQGR